MQRDQSVRPGPWDQKEAQLPLLREVLGFKGSTGTMPSTENILQHIEDRFSLCPQDREVRTRTRKGWEKVVVVVVVVVVGVY